MNADEAEQIRERMKKLDGAPVETPPLLWLTELVRREKRRAEKKSRNEFAVFLFLSLLIPGGMMQCLIASIPAFLILQTAPLAVMAFLAARARRTGVPR